MTVFKAEIISSQLSVNHKLYSLLLIKSGLTNTPPTYQFLTPRDSPVNVVRTTLWGQIMFKLQMILIQSYFKIILPISTYKIPLCYVFANGPASTSLLLHEITIKRKKQNKIMWGFRDKSYYPSSEAVHGSSLSLVLVHL